MPASVPGRNALAYFAAAFELFCGVGLLFAERTAERSARAPFYFMLAWILGLSLPWAINAPRVVDNWLGIGEIGVLVAGAWVLLGMIVQSRHDSSAGFFASARGVRCAQMLFALSLPPIGASHLVDVAGTAGLVPEWLPFRTFLAIATGIAQIAAGLGVLFSFYPRWSAIVEASLVTSFALIVWLPHVVMTRTMRLPWTAFLISWAIGAAAWVVAASFSTGSVEPAASSGSSRSRG